jgi:TetR/AcrR family transcriptional repressor of nem operon
MDAAESRIRSGGYDGFSFRTLADDIGVKSSSVHYHFGTKDALAAAVTRRYQDRLLAAVDADIEAGVAPVEAWRSVFRAAIADGAQMCLCGALAATPGLLSEPVADEVHRFFVAAVDNLTSNGLSAADAARVLATLEGAILMASIQKDLGIFERATEALGG